MGVARALEEELDARNQRAVTGKADGLLLVVRLDQAVIDHRAGDDRAVLLMPEQGERAARGVAGGEVMVVAGDGGAQAARSSFQVSTSGKCAMGAGASQGSGVRCV